MIRQKCEIKTLSCSVTTARVEELPVSYFALLPASLLARRRTHLATAAILLVTALILAAVKSSENWTYISLFASGMLSASIREVWPKLQLPQAPASMAALLKLATLLTLHSAPYTAIQSGLLAIVFFLVCNGATFFGPFTTNAAVRLGHASYAIYLLQGFTFSLGWDNGPVRAFLSHGAVNFWSATFVSVLALSAVAAIVFVTIERPGIALGRTRGNRASRAVAQRYGVADRSTVVEVHDFR